MLPVRTCRHICEKNLVDKIVGDKEAQYPILGPNTTSTDYDEMLHIWNMPGATIKNLEYHRAKKQQGDVDDMTLTQLGQHTESIALTNVAKTMQGRLAEIESQEKILTEEEQNNFMSTMIKMGKSVSECELGNESMKIDFLSKVQKAHDEYIEEINKKRGKKGGGKGSLMMAGVTKQRSANNGRRRGGV